MKYPKIFLAFLLAGGTWLLTSQKIQASTDFVTSLQTTYVVSAQGQTQVTQSISLTNKSPTLFSTQYALKISSPNIKNVTVTSNGKTLPAEIVPTDTQTSIGITFPDQIVGEGKTRQFAISYQNPDAAVLSNKILEIQVPKIANAADYDSYSVTISTPAQFGLPTRVTPNNYETRQDVNTITTSLSPQNGESVTLFFGDQQIFETRLRYHLNNTSENTSLAQIALPPDTIFQKMSYQVLEPEPQSLTEDGDGNWIATYEVPAQNQVTVYAVAKVLITLTPRPDYPQTSASDQEIASQQYWETEAPPITQLAGQLSSVRDVYEYVVKNLSYDYQKTTQTTPVERLGAVATLAKMTQATCQEFTDLFVTLARAKHIPARRLTGYAYTQNQILRPLSLQQDVLHAWPEYYDQDTKTWIPVDPTWENTTGGVNYFDHFDLNHIVFAINGLSSTLPYPAGSYKNPDSNDRDVEVVFSPDFPEVPLKLNLKIVSSASPLVWLGKEQLQLKNTTGQAWYNVHVAPSSPNDTLTIQGLPETIEQILPYQTLNFPITVSSHEARFGQQSTLQLTASYLATDVTTDANQKTLTPTSLTLNPVVVHVAPSFVTGLTQTNSLITLGISGLVLACLTGGLLVYGRRRSRAVRRKS